ncbi:hypothetical protein BH09MYX1_BH09MYX1_30130 [soil metagenome]
MWQKDAAMLDVVHRLLRVPAHSEGILDMPLEEYLAGVGSPLVVSTLRDHAKPHRRSLREVLSDARFQRWIAVIAKAAVRKHLAPELEVVSAIVEEEYILDEPPAPPTVDLRARAIELGLKARLAEPVTMLGRQVRHEAHRLSRSGKVSIGAVLDPETFRIASVLNEREREALVARAESYVREMCDRALAARAEDKRVAKLAFQPPGEGARAMLEAIAAARARNGDVQSFDLGIPRVRLVHGPERIEVGWPMRTREGIERVVIAALPLDDWRGAKLEYRIETGVRKEPKRANDLVLRAVWRVLSDPRHAWHAELAAHLDEPSWKRTLAALDEIEVAAPSRVELRWTLSSHPPYLHLRLPNDDQFVPPPVLLDNRRLALSPRDEAAARALRSAYDYAAYRAPNESRARIVDAAQWLVGHPRVQTSMGAPLRVVGGACAIALVPAEGGFTFAFTVGEEPIGAEDLRAALDVDGNLLHVDVDCGRALVARVGHERAQIALALARERVVFPDAARDELLPRLAALSVVVPIDIPEELAGELTPADHRPHVRLAREGGDSFALTFESRPIEGGRDYELGEQPAQVFERVAGRVVVAKRDLGAEREALAALRAKLPPPTVARSVGALFVGLDLVLQLIGTLRELVTEGVAVVEWPKQMPRVVGRADFSRLRLNVGASGDWFGVSGKVDLGDLGDIPLETLLTAARARKKFVAISADHFVELEDDLRARLAAIDDVTRKHGAERGVARAAIPAFLDALGSRDAIDALPAFWSLLDRIDAAKARDAVVPRRFVPILRSYQVDGFRWLSRLAAWGAGACLADEMGLGKTVQALALLLARKKLGPALVVAPTSVGPNWLAEAERFAPSLRRILHRGSERAAALATVGPGDLVVTSYDLMVRDAEALSKIRFSTFIADEAQAIKTGTTARARAARSIDADFRVALTGTPVENRLSELFSLMEFLNPGLLGSSDDFRTRYVVPVERDRDAMASASLAKAVRPFLLRRRKADVLAELPPRTNVTRVVERGLEERRLYEAARRVALEVAEDSDEDARFNVLAEIMRLRRLACHPKLFDETTNIPSAKLDAFLEIVAELREGGHRALVFSQFTGHLALVAEALRTKDVGFLYLDGKTPLAERTRLVKSFQAGDAELFLISLKAGGTGLNLTAADTVIHLDPWWNPAVEDQATDRAHRIGQTRPVTVLRLISQSTIEEAVVALHDHKRDLADSILEGAAASGKLSLTELTDLIRAGASS